MSKYHKIRWTEADQKELKRVVRNFNAKISRLEKKDPQEYNKNTLPTFYDSKTDTFTNRITVEQLKDLIGTRQDLKRELNALKRFSKRGSEEIVTISNNDNNLKLTKWQRTEMNRRVATINKRRAKRLKEIQETEVKYQGESLGYTIGDIGMGKQHMNELKPLNAFTEGMEKYSLKYKWATIFKQSQHDYFDARDYGLREGFIKGIEDNYRSSDSKAVIEAIRNMDISDFLKIYYEDPNAFEWAYPPNEEEYQGYVNHLKSTWIPQYQE